MPVYAFGKKHFLTTHLLGMATSLTAVQASESGQRVLLHPLVLLTASDLIVRHRLRQVEGPIAGILLGQQQGTQVTAEHAFTAKLKDGLLDQTDDWTSKRIAQCTQFLCSFFALC